MFDLSNLNTTDSGDTGAKLHLRHPGTDELLYADDAETKPVEIKLCGSDSKRFRKINAQLVRRMQGKKKQTNDDVENGVTEQLVGVTLGWQNLIMNGQEQVFDQETATNIYNEYRWIREQVAAFVADRSNFLPTA